MTFIDLSHTFSKNTPVYPGDASPQFISTNTIERDEFTSYSLVTGMHVGTHIDAPLHMIQNGKKMSELPIETFCDTGVLLDARGEKN